MTARTVKAKAPAKPAAAKASHVKPARKASASKARKAADEPAGGGGMGSAPARPRRKAAPPPRVVRDSRDTLDPTGSTAARLLKKLRDENVEFRPSQARKGAFHEEDFMDFFGAEIEAELARPAQIVHDRYARWPCQCCDAIIPVPRRTEVFHGDYHLVHDDVMGLLVNGERWIPKAETPLEVVQPGRLRNPWTGKTLTGKDLGTTGTYG